MSLAVNIDKDNSIIHVHASSIVDAEMLAAHERHYWSNNEFDGWHHLVDFRQCLLDISHSELFTLATHSVPTNVNYTGARTAVVVADGVQEELVEFYQEARHEICPPSIREVAIFECDQRAQRWLTDATVQREPS